MSTVIEEWMNKYHKHTKEKSLEREKKNSPKKNTYTKNAFTKVAKRVFFTYWVIERSSAP